MDVITAIEKRREITSFHSLNLQSETLKQLERAFYLSPSGNNLPSRECIVVTDRVMLNQLSVTTPYMKWLEQAAAGFVIVANSELSKYWLQDATIAGSYLWLTATSLQLGAAWGAVYHSENYEESAQREQFVREQLNVPESLRVVAILGIGYPAIDPPPKEMYPIEQIMHHEYYQSSEE